MKIYFCTQNVQIVENTNANKLIKELQVQVISHGIQANTIVPELKKLREIALLEQNPVVVKALRLAYEYIEKNNDFDVEIPSDEPIDDVEQNLENNTNIENFNYFLSLMLDLENKHNISDLKEFNEKLK